MTVRDPDEDDRLIEAAREIAPTLPAAPRRGARMTTPLGTLEVLERDGRRVRVARRTRETEITIALDLDGTGAASDRDRGRASTTTSWRSLAHHGLLDLEIRATGDLHVDEHHTVEDVALVLGAAFAEALGDRAGIRRFGDSLGADGRVASRPR